MSSSEDDEDDDEDDEDDEDDKAGNKTRQNLNEAKQTQVPRGTWGMTPLMLICRDATCSFQFMEWEMIVRDLIVDHGCDVNFPHPKNGMTPLHYAVKSGNRALSILLLGLGADPARPRYTDGKTPLHIACARSGGVDVGSTMMERLKGDDEDATSLDPYDIAGSTPLHEAMATARDISLVRELLSHGANPTLAGKTGRSKIGSKCTPMGWLSYQGGQMHLKMMVSIADSLEKNPLATFNINARDPCGLSPLHLASRGGKDGVVRWMLDRWSSEIDVNVRCSKNFKTPMEYAEANGHVSTLRLLKRFVAKKDTNVEEEVGDPHGMRARRGGDKGARASSSVEQAEEKVVPKMKQI
jgi:ankyrin repeat protein